MKFHNKSSKKYLTVIIILLSCIITAYAMPRAQYKGTGFISGIDIPYKMNNWTGRDITDQLNLDFDKNWNKFISEAKIIEYISKSGQKATMIILDAGNFHHPNVCFTASGYTIKELKDQELNVSGRKIKAHTLFTEKGKIKNISIYWIIIDKNIVHEWIEQKIKQLYFSLFNRERVGLMVRFDIPTDENNIQGSIDIAQQFISELSQAIQPKYADYICGEY